MWDWISDTYDAVSSAISETDWANVMNESLTTAVVGAGVGALASAVSDGDISEGLLWGAAGGLVSGGLAEFGGQFFDNFQWSNAQKQVDAVTGFNEEDMELARMQSQETASTENVPGFVKAGQSGQVQGDQKGGWGSFWGPQTTAMALQVGGGMLAGAFKRDVEGGQMDFLKEKEQRGRDAVRSFAASPRQRGSFTPGVSVREQAKNKDAVGFSKEEAGVNVG